MVHPRCITGLGRCCRSWRADSGTCKTPWCERTPPPSSPLAPSPQHESSLDTRMPESRQNRRRMHNFLFALESPSLEIRQTLNQLKCLTEAGRQKTDCSVTRHWVKSTSFWKSGKCFMSMPTCKCANMDTLSNASEAIKVTSSQVVLSETMPR